MSYESPIRLITDEYALRLIEDEERNIIKAVANYGINIDKDELVKLINNDRKQYEKGYADGWREMKKSLVRCEDCKYQDEPPEEDKGFIVCKKCSTWDTMLLTHPDDYCSWGERKEDGTD